MRVVHKCMIIKAEQFRPELAKPRVPKNVKVYGNHAKGFIGVFKGLKIEPGTWILSDSFGSQNIEDNASFVKKYVEVK
jgi:hypothetical protein